MHHNEDLTLSGGWRILLHFSCLGKIKIISVSWSHRKSSPGPVTREGEWDQAVNIYSRDQYFANLRRKLGKNVQNCMWDNAKQGVLVTSNGWRVKISEWKLHAQSINKYWKHDMRPAFININLLEIWDIINGNYLYIYLEPPSSARRSLRLQKLCWAHHWWCDDLAGPELQPVHWGPVSCTGPWLCRCQPGEKDKSLAIGGGAIISFRLHYTPTPLHSHKVCGANNQLSWHCEMNHSAKISSVRIICFQWNKAQSKPTFCGMFLLKCL